MTDSNSEPVNMEELRCALQKTLQCGKCTKRVKVPFYVCTNGKHLKCSSCYRSDSHCSVDNCTRVGLNDNEYEFLNDMVTSFYFNCEYSDFGCKLIATPDILNKHEAICDYRTVECILLKNGKNCQEKVSLPFYAEHIESYHDSYVRIFTLGSNYETIIPKKSNLENNKCHYRVLKDDTDNKLYFLEMTYYDENLKFYQISVHYIGKQSEASNYIYSIEVVNKTSSFHQFKYSNKCLGNLSKPDEVKKFYPFLLFDQDDKFSVHEEVQYHLKIESYSESDD